MKDPKVVKADVKKIKASRRVAPSQAKPEVEKFAKLVQLLKEHPGQTAIQLEHLGWQPETDGALEDAELAGLIVWVRKKWFAV